MNAMTQAERNALKKGPPGVKAIRTAPLGAMDRWIVSRLAFAADSVNKGLEEYNFPQATTALYNFWLYELCDVYLEYLKPVFRTGGNPGAALTARNVLYTCLDGGLRLISPFMPFISEELYQRLPRVNPDSDPPSIMVTPYPEPRHYPREVKLEGQVDYMQKVVAAVRSARSSYNLPNKVKTKLTLKASDEDLAASLKTLSKVISTLAYCEGDVRVMGGSDEVMTSGCAIVTVSDKCTAYLTLTGLIDPATEGERLEKRRALLLGVLDKLNKAMKAEGYAEKVPAQVRDQNKVKLEETNAELDKLKDAATALKSL